MPVYIDIGTRVTVCTLRSQLVTMCLKGNPFKIPTPMLNKVVTNYELY